MIKAQWQKLNDKVNALSLRERVLVFAALAFLLVSLADTFLFTPLLNKQKLLSSQVVQQQEKIKEVQAQIDALIEARNGATTSPQYMHLNEVRQKLVDTENNLQKNREKLVAPDRMAELLRQMLSRNAGLQLMKLETLPVTTLLDDNAAAAAGAAPPVKADTVGAAAEKQIWKHGVRLTVRGNYLDLLQYMNALEHLPSQMIWNQAQLKVGQYPAADLTITLYTLSLDKTWLQI